MKEELIAGCKKKPHNKDSAMYCKLRGKKEGGEAKIDTVLELDTTRGVPGDSLRD